MGAALVFWVKLKDQRSTNGPNIYEAVFLGVLIDADFAKQKEVLSDFGLKSPLYLKNVKKGYWSQANQLYKDNLNEEFYKKISNYTVIQMYLKNPDLFIKTAYIGIKELFSNSAQPNHLGNLTIEKSINQKKTLVFGILGETLNILLFPVFVIILIYYIFLKKALKNRRENQLILFLLFIIPLVFCANFVTGGINDFVKHNLSLYFMMIFLIMLSFISLVRQA